MLNEAAQLPSLLEHLLPFVRRGTEVVLVDGGSDDDSVALARAAGFTVLESAPGRARQMNLGARASRGEALLFLHADTRLPADALAAVDTALRHHVWGRFDVSIAGRSPLLPMVAMLMNLRSRLSGIATGDQAIFMTRRAFDAVGGFPDQPLMEDLAICQSLKRLGRPACLKLRVTTSGRRWDTRGVWRTIALMWWLRWRYWRGASPEALAKAYR
ncbi:TIGR04283 family arsenosugar biosynthesis glycosyltransferase [Sinimarinibacterium thermocellulolyticum]